MATEGHPTKSATLQKAPQLEVDFVVKLFGEIAVTPHRIYSVQQQPLAGAKRIERNSFVLVKLQRPKLSAYAVMNLFGHGCEWRDQCLG